LTKAHDSTSSRPYTQPQLALTRGAREGSMGIEARAAREQTLGFQSKPTKFKFVPACMRQKVKGI